MSSIAEIDNAIQAMFANVERGPEVLHVYQTEKGIPFLLKNPFSGLFVDMGLGKSVMCLTMIRELLLDIDDDDKILVIGPLRVANETWPTEITLWSHTAFIPHQLIHVGDDHDDLVGVPAFQRAAVKERLRKQAAMSKKRVHIVSRNLIEWLVEFWGHKWPYRTVIIDESSNFKDHNSVGFKALLKIRNTKGLITRLHILTATPAAETYEHLFAQIYLLDGGERLGRMITHYRNKYFSFNQYKRKYVIQEGGEERILDKIKDICMVLKADEYLDVAKPKIMRRPVTLSPKELKLYKTLEKEFVVQLDDGTEIEAETAAVLSQKLLQLSSGVLYETVQCTNNKDDMLRKKNVVHHIHDYKIEEIKQIVDELQGQPLLIAYHFKSSLDRLLKAFPKAVQMDKEGKCVKDWNKGKIPILLMHPQSGGHGLNLQQGGHHMAFFDIPWSLELYLQFIGRLARQGQKHVVMVWLLCAKETMDYGVADALVKKENAQDQFFDKLRRMIRKFRKQREEARGRAALETADDEL